MFYSLPPLRQQDYKYRKDYQGNNRSTAARIGLDAAKILAVTAAFVAGAILLVYVTTREN